MRQQAEGLRNFGSIFTFWEGSIACLVLSITLELVLVVEDRQSRPGEPVLCWAFNQQLGGNRSLVVE